MSGIHTLPLRSNKRNWIYMKQRVNRIMTGVVNNGLVIPEYSNIRI